MEEKNRSRQEENHTYDPGGGAPTREAAKHPDLLVAVSPPSTLCEWLQKRMCHECTSDIGLPDGRHQLGSKGTARFD